MNTVKGYKVTNPDSTCRNFLYEVGKEYKHNGDISLCNKGFHFCLKAVDCFNYYDFNPENKVYEIEATGAMEHGDDKSVTDTIKIIREIEWSEVLNIVNTGTGNTGLRNSGNRNSGYSNSGDRNSGYSNSGYRNSGDSNSGDRNSGDSNSGDSNSGDSNSGYSNSGDSNSGNSNSGDSNSGNWNSGNRNSGDSNSGYRNSGYRNSGNRNSGDSNSGDSNSGDSNSGYRNSGYRNSGNSNSGNWNSGYWNSGNWNSGYSNSGDRNSGAFCTGEPAFILFNKPTEMTIHEFEQSRVYDLLCQVDTTLWIPESKMSEDEKKANPSYKTCEGYLKIIPYKESFQNAWHNWDEDARKQFTSLPNFDKDIFFEITGVNVDQ